MLNCTMGWHQILGLFYFLFFINFHLLYASFLCPPNQRDALLNFKNSFYLNKTDCYPYLQSKCALEWNKSIDCCSWNGVTCNNVTGNVIGLEFSSVQFHVTIYSNSYLLLPKLQVLTISYCNLNKFPYFLNSLESLTDLDLSFNEISGEIPRWFWGISHHTLKRLDLSNNHLEGGIHQLHWKRLSYIDLQNNSFQGPLPIPSPSTRYFYAMNNNFTGEIPSSICQLSSLLELNLSSNNLLGAVPPCFGNMSKLLILDLSNNSLLGNIPPSFGNITNLELLDLSNNKLQGPLPRSLVKWKNLLGLFLNHNKFNDIFPHWLKAPQLRYLDLQSNKFHSMINVTTFELSFPALEYLLISNNNFIGQWPAKVFFNTSLGVIDLSNNKFGGPIPLTSPVTVYYSIASNIMTGKIPSLICNATFLQTIDLSNNSLTGSFPQCLTNHNINLSVLNLRMNQLKGTIPQSTSLINGLLTLDLSGNRFEGTLPRSLVNCTYLQVLDLSRNQIEDTFPRWLGKLPELKVLILRSNNFKGLLNIPKGDLIFSKLRILDLSNNNFSGPLSANLIMNLRGMENREVGEDEPLYMTWFTSPYGMASYENTVTVMMKGQEIKLEKILTIFTTIDLSHNSFQGDIPEAFGHLRSLVGLNLSHNRLIGSIPLTLGNLTNLGWLDLSSNMLSGEIPRVLGDLASLGYLNLSKNQLIGRIPQDKQLSTFSNDSFSENPSLCGTPLSKACLDDAQPPPPPSSTHFDRERHESWFKKKVVWIGYASGIVIGISIAYIAFEIGRPEWLARGMRMLERSATQWMEKPKWKAIKFHGQ
ncbi:hypothetical protein ACJRO7_022791 [Eucalyptus globulus]|uniref:Leucine-rich repeat-containing N-terminal plant-type domain-containing protein n=1 Tax=Eucalyptus globulus TaxID=34317 RepID=A0ABD3K0V6_EUCGL